MCYFTRLNSDICRRYVRYAINFTITFSSPKLYGTSKDGSSQTLLTLRNPTIKPLDVPKFIKCEGSFYVLGFVNFQIDVFDDNMDPLHLVSK